MAYFIIPGLVALSCALQPPVQLNATAKDPVSCLRSNHCAIIIADQHEGEDPHDPRMDDPHEEDPKNPVGCSPNSPPYHPEDPGIKYANPLPPDDPYTNYENPYPTGRPY